VSFDHDFGTRVCFALFLIVAQSGLRWGGFFSFFGTVHTFTLFSSSQFAVVSLLARLFVGARVVGRSGGWLAWFMAGHLAYYPGARRAVLRIFGWVRRCWSEGVVGYGVKGLYVAGGVINE